jgi:hypothetical protein
MKVNKVNCQYTQVRPTPNSQHIDRRLKKSIQSIKVSTRFNLLYTVYKGVDLLHTYSSTPVKGVYDHQPLIALLFQNTISSTSIPS